MNFHVETRERVAKVERAPAMRQQDSRAIFAIDAQGNIVEANASALRLMGCMHDEAIGSFYSRYLKLLHLGDGLIGGAFEAGEKECISIAGLVCGSDGKSCPIDGLITCLEDENGAVIGVRLVAESC
jgi:PAS domain S-box-containing protein